MLWHYYVELSLPVRVMYGYKGPMCAAEDLAMDPEDSPDLPVGEDR
jgi:hypothetical protein